MGKRPFMFIGSSKEGLDAAKAIQQNLDHSVECQLWTQGVFGLSGGTLESLVARLDDFDFATLVLTGDDLVTSRGVQKPAPRDNVLLELGLFIGRIGRERTFIVCDREAKLKLPSDLFGITPATYQMPDKGNMQTALGNASTEIEWVAKSLGSRSGRRIQIQASYFQDASCQEGLGFRVINTGKSPLPPYRIGLFHPKRPSLYLFPSEDSGQLLPDEHRHHRFPIVINNKVGTWFPKVEFDFHGNPLTSEDWENFSFQLVMEKGTKVLYENWRIGKGLALILKKVREDQSFANVNGIEFGELSDIDEPLPDIIEQIIDNNSPVE